MTATARYAAIVCRSRFALRAATRPSPDLRAGCGFSSTLDAFQAPSAGAIVTVLAGAPQAAGRRLTRCRIPGTRRAIDTILKQIGNENVIFTP